MSLLLTIDAYRVGLIGMWTLLVILILILIYNFVLRKFKKSVVMDLTDYIVLHPLEMMPAKGEVDFYFTMEMPKHVDFLIKDEKGGCVKTLLSSDLAAGSHIVKFDTRQVENGKYSFEVKSENQQTMKFFEILN